MPAGRLDSPARPTSACRTSLPYDDDAAATLRDDYATGNSPHYYNTVFGT